MEKHNGTSANPPSLKVTGIMGRTEAITAEDLIRFVRGLKKNYRGLVSREEWINGVDTDANS